METKDKVVSPEREAIEVRLKEQELGYRQTFDRLEIERMQIEVEAMKRKGYGCQSAIDQLLDVAKACCIDTDRSASLGSSDPVYKSLWDEDELAEIKLLIMQKVKKL